MRFARPDANCVEIGIPCLVCRVQLGILCTRARRPRESGRGVDLISGVGLP